MPLRPLCSLGAGAMARVVLAETDAGDLVAVKIAHAATRRDPALRALFEREATAATKSAHPHLVRCLRFVPEPLAMVLEHVDGPSLDAVQSAAPLLSPELAVLVIADVARGLLALENEGGGHGDLCGRNVLVERTGIAKLSDYGAALGTRGFVGTAGYAAPERVRGSSSLDERRADLFSLGVLAWELLRGERLFDGADDAQRLLASVERLVAPVDAERPALGPFAGIVASLLARDPAQRPGGAAAAVTAFSWGESPTARARLGSHVEQAFAQELARRDRARNAVAPPNPDG